MTQKLFLSLRLVSLLAVASFGLMLAPLPSHAQEGQPTEAATRSEAAQDSAKANEEKGSSAAKETPGAKRDETHTGRDPIMKDAATGADAKEPKAAEKPPTDAEKKLMIEAADAITAFDPAKEVGIAKPWQTYYQAAASPPMEQIEPLHDAVMIIITVIVIFVLALMIYICVRFNRRCNPKPQTFTHNKTIEIIWTVLPILILVGIAIPSLRVHYKYYNNETIINNPDLTLKVVGHQWYWSYEYPDQGIAFDSNITPDKDLKNGEPRLLTVDNPVVVPVNKVVRVQLTGADVMHAFAIPAFGIKKGAIPGRLNETWFKAEKEGVYYGQCSILCGKLHGFMPIKIIVVSDEEFAAWVKGAKLKFANNDAMQFAALNQ